VVRANRTGGIQPLMTSGNSPKAGEKGEARCRQIVDRSRPVCCGPGAPGAISADERRRQAADASRSKKWVSAVDG